MILMEYINLQCANCGLFEVIEGGLVPMFEKFENKIKLINNTHFLTQIQRNNFIFNGQNNYDCFNFHLKSSQVNLLTEVLKN